MLATIVTQNQPPPPEFFLIFIVGWFAIGFFFSLTSGWYRMAKIYKANQRPYGKAYLWQSGEVGWVNINNGLNIHIIPEGMFVSVVLLFRLSFPTLFIPWSEIAVLREDKFLWMRTVTISIGNPQLGTITLPRKIFEQQGMLT